MRYVTLLLWISTVWSLEAPRAVLQRHLMALQRAANSGNHLQLIQSSVRGTNIPALIQLLRGSQHDVQDARYLNVDSVEGVVQHRNAHGRPQMYRMTIGRFPTSPTQWVIRESVPFAVGG
ncbi:unnamed protein product [Caenorhabditis sp. 36 PRJEB53466]|nr:unnamed protein product [Caenorhabditis sp. 36 PRJEB53466]